MILHSTLELQKKVREDFTDTDSKITRYRWLYESLLNKLPDPYDRDCEIFENLSLKLYSAPRIS